MPALLVSHRRPGFYLRVLEEGDVQAGDEIVKVAPGREQMTVAEIDAPALPARAPARSSSPRALRIPALSPGWQASFAGAARSGDAPRRPATPGSPPASAAAGVAGFRQLRVAAITPESDSGDLARAWRTPTARRCRRRCPASS